MKRGTSRLLLIVAGLIPVVAMLISGLGGDRSLHRRVIEEADAVVAASLADDDLEGLVSDALAVIQQRFNTPAFHVNRQYQSGVLNVYLMSSRFYKEWAKASPLQLSHRNFIAIAPDIIVVDGDYLAFLTEQAVTDYASKVEILSDERKGGEFFSTAGSIRRSLEGTDMLRLGNLNAYLVNGDLVGAETVASDYRRLQGYPDDRAMKLGELTHPSPLLNNIFYVLYSDLHGELGSTGQLYRPQDALVDTMANLLSFVVLHEMGHLKAGEDGGFLEAGHDSIAQPAVLAAERNADAYAASALRLRMDAETQAGQYAIAFGTASAARVLRDTAFARLWSGFRGFDSAQKFGFFIDYDPWKDCRHSVRGFFDMNLIDDIRPTLFPLLTTSEADALSRRAVDERATSHDGYVARSDALLGKLSLAGGPFARSRDALVDEFDLYRRQVYLDLAERRLDRLNETYASLFQRLGGAIDGTKAMAGTARGHIDLPLIGVDMGPIAACPAARCTVSMDAASGIYVETAMDNAGNPVFWRTTIPGVLPKDASDVEEAERNPERRAVLEHRWEYTIQTVHGLTRQLGFTKQEMMDVEQFLGSVYTCGFGSFSISHPSWQLRASTLGDWKEVAIEFRANASPPPPARQASRPSS